MVNKLITIAAFFPLNPEPFVNKQLSP